MSFDPYASTAESVAASKQTARLEKIIFRRRALLGVAVLHGLARLAMFGAETPGEVGAIGLVSLGLLLLQAVATVIAAMSVRWWLFFLGLPAFVMGVISYADVLAVWLWLGRVIERESYD